MRNAVAVAGRNKSTQLGFHSEDVFARPNLPCHRSKLRRLNLPTAYPIVQMHGM